MINQDFLGWLAFFVLILIFFLITKKHKETKNFLISAFIIRSLFVILDQYFITLPESTGDAHSFEIKAFIYSEKYGLDIYSIILQEDSFFISKFISIFYMVFDRSEMMAKMLSVGFGTGSVFLLYRLSLFIWDESSALKVGWFATFFPSLILYSSVILREIYIVFFLTYALINCVIFITKNKLIYFIKLSIGFFVASLFHGPIIIGFIIFLIYMFFVILKQNNYFIRFKRKNLYLLILLPFFLLPLITYFLGYYSIPKIGSIKNLASSKYYKEQNKKLLLEERIIWKINKATRSSKNENGASYPKWTIPNDLKEIIYLTPVRMIYFLYSPFPWDIRRLAHIVGFFDGLLFMFLTYSVLQNYKNLYRNPQTRFLLLILFFYILIYSFGVGNFGTSIRHRLKFVGVLIVLAAQRIPRFKLF